jgi:hypothetical protein
MFTPEELRKIAEKGVQAASRKSGPGFAILMELSHALKQAADRIDRFETTARAAHPSAQPMDFQRPLITPGDEE